MSPEIEAELGNIRETPAESLILKSSYSAGTYKELDAGLYVPNQIQAL